MGIRLEEIYRQIMPNKLRDLVVGFGRGAEWKDARNVPARTLILFVSRPVCQATDTETLTSQLVPFALFTALQVPLALRCCDGGSVCGQFSPGPVHALAVQWSRFGQLIAC
ncbi:hypothetical protein BaRGS_00017244 [Batillaria attramentaria]|uniref:Uncharacterized protein n=1 Tax=Batillaria attramentaria TaxID=370345 RepID=A0ABD0KWI4_9CAEN